MSEWDDRRGDEETSHGLCPCQTCVAHRQQLTESNRHLKNALFLAEGKIKHIEESNRQPLKRTSGVSREQMLGALVVHWRVLLAQDYSVVEGSATDAFAICAKQLEGLLKSDEWAIAHWEPGGMTREQSAVPVKSFIDGVKAELRRVSKGQMETWGFVSMFNDILDNVYAKTVGTHTHKGPERTCGACGLDIANEIHLRETNKTKK